MRRNGFTLIELLVVISIIGLLVTIVSINLNKARTKSKYAKAKADMKILIEMIDAARLQSGKTLMEITGSGCSECTCRNRGDITQLPKTDSCWTSYINAFNKIAALSKPAGFDVKTPPTDPWGAPFLLNENEGEHCCCSDTTYWCCTDNLHSAGPDGVLSLNPNSDDINVNIPTRSCSPTAGSHHPNQNWD